jgi:uncharacterized protein involved in outer membrane biogenesis
MESKGMATAPDARRRWVVALTLLVVAVLVAVALRFALRGLPEQVARALGPRASVEAIELGWTGVQVRGLVLKGAPGRWPAAHELRATRVTIRPALASLWREGWTIGALTVEDATLVLLRTREGRIVATPSLLESAGGEKKKGSAPLHIDRLVLRDVVLELHDASVVPRGAAPHRLRLTDAQGDLGPLALPALDEAMTIDLKAAFDGPRRDGRVTLAGRLTPATRDADLKLDAKGLALVALQPYLLKSGEARVSAGTLDLALHARAQQQRLHAPGRLTLRGLELQSGGGPLGTFAGVPRQAVLAAMSRDGAIELDFTLEGRVDDPKFSLNEVFAARFAFGLAEKLGVTLGGVVEGVGSVIKGLLGR